MARFVIRPGTGIHGPEAAPRRPVDIHNSYRDAATVGAWLGNLSKAGTLISDAGLAMKNMSRAYGAEDTWQGVEGAPAQPAAQPGDVERQRAMDAAGFLRTPGYDAPQPGEPPAAAPSGGLIPVPGDTGQMPPGLLKSLAALEAEYPNKGEIYEAKKVATMGAWSDLIQTLPRKHWQGAPQPVAQAAAAGQPAAQPGAPAQPGARTALTLPEAPQAPGIQYKDPHLQRAEMQAQQARALTSGALSGLGYGGAAAGAAAQTPGQIQQLAGQIDLGSMDKLFDGALQAGQMVAEGDPVGRRLMSRVISLFEKHGRDTVFQTQWGTLDADKIRDKLIATFKMGSSASRGGRGVGSRGGRGMTEAQARRLGLSAATGARADANLSLAQGKAARDIVAGRRAEKRLKAKDVELAAKAQYDKANRPFQLKIAQHKSINAKAYWEARIGWLNNRDKPDDKMWFSFHASHFKQDSTAFNTAHKAFNVAKQAALTEVPSFQALVRSTADAKVASRTKARQELNKSVAGKRALAEVDNQMYLMKAAAQTAEYTGQQALVDVMIRSFSNATGIPYEEARAEVYKTIKKGKPK